MALELGVGLVGGDSFTAGGYSGYGGGGVWPPPPVRPTRPAPRCPSLYVFMRVRKKIKWGLRLPQAREETRPPPPTCLNTLTTTLQFTAARHSNSLPRA